MKTSNGLTKIFIALLILFCFDLIVNGQGIYTLPAGTIIRVRMDNEINSKVSNVGDTFTATVSSPVIVSGAEVIPVGSVIEAKITKIKAAEAGKKNGSIEIKFGSLRLRDDKVYSIDASLVNQDLIGQKSSAFTKVSIVGGTIIGAIIGGVVGKGAGAGIGAGIGAGAGTAASYLKKGNEARIKANEEFDIRLNKEIAIPAKDY